MWPARGWNPATDRTPETLAQAFPQPRGDHWRFGSRKWSRQAGSSVVFQVPSSAFAFQAGLRGSLPDPAIRHHLRWPTQPFYTTRSEVYIVGCLFTTPQRRPRGSVRTQAQAEAQVAVPVRRIEPEPERRSAAPGGAEPGAAPAHPARACCRPH